MEKPTATTASASTSTSATANRPNAGDRPAAAAPYRPLLTSTTTPIPISDPEERHHRKNKMKSFSQPLSRGGGGGDPSAAAASAALALRKKQNSLELSSTAATARAFSYPHYHFPVIVGTPPPPPVPNPNPNPNPDALPEFTGSGGGTGIFKLPARASMHPGRPLSLELRPHPLRETQVGSFLRSIACTRSQLWASTECGVRFWEFSRVFGGHKGRKRGDEETAPFRESSRTSPTMCLVLDERRGLVWTGHKDGKIRSWKMNQDGGGGAEGEEGGSSFKEGLSWHAHRSAVLSLILSSNGKLTLMIKC